MGSSSSNINATRGLTNAEVFQLKRHFKAASSGWFSKKISFTEFMTLYKLLNPSCSQDTIELIAQRAFLASDRNRSGKLNFDEFLMAYKLTKSKNIGENMSCVLQDYCDPARQNQGRLTKDQAYSYCCYLYDFYGRPSSVDPRSVLSVFGESSTITYSEFIYYTAPLYEQHIFY